MTTTIITFTPGPDVPRYDGPLSDDMGGDGSIYWPDGSTTSGTHAEWLQVLRERYPHAISERQPCPTCGK